MQNTMPLSEIREKLQRHLQATKTSRDKFAWGIGVSAFTINRFLSGNGVQRATRFKIVAEMEKRGWLEIEPAAEQAAEQQPEGPSEEPNVDLPYPDVTGLSEDGGPSNWKYMANLLVQAKSLPHNKGKEEEIDKKIEEFKKEAERPDGPYRYDISDLSKANPINQLTQDEKLHCIRTLPVPIVQKLFPNL